MASVSLPAGPATTEVVASEVTPVVNLEGFAMSDAAPAPAFAEMTERLRAVGLEVRDTHEAWQTALDRRDQLVLDALDQGMPQRAIAEAVGVSQQRVGRLTLPRADRRPA